MATRVDKETGNCRECQGGLTCMHCHPEDRPTQTLRIAELETALRELTDACLAEFGDGETAPREPDDSSVYAGVPNGHGITFGMLRRARAVLAKTKAV